MDGNQQDAAVAPLAGDNQLDTAVPLTGTKDLLRRANSARNPGQAEEAADKARAPQKGPDRHNHRH